MKVTVQEIPLAPEKPTYPRLMTCTENPSIIVMFVADKKGVVVSDNTDRTSLSLGSYHETFSMGLWIPFKGMVVLES